MRKKNVSCKELVLHSTEKNKLIELQIKKSKNIKKEKLVSSKYSFLIDFGNDTSIVDIVCWSITIVFSILFIIISLTFLDEVKLSISGKGNWALIATLAPSFTQISSTFVTLIYSYAFFIASNNKNIYIKNEDKGNESIAIFFDFSGDGKIGFKDILCCVTGIVNVISLVINIILWYYNYIDLMQVVSLIGAVNRVIVLFLTKSYLGSNEQKNYEKSFSSFMYFIDINHDGEFQLVDVMATIINLVYWSSVFYSWIMIIFSPVGTTNVNIFISLTSHLTAILVALFALLLVSKNLVTKTKKFAINIFSICYLILLIRTIMEMFLQDEMSFSGITKFGNGLVLPVVSLMSATMLVQKTNV